VPALVRAADAAAQRDPVLDEVEFLGVEVSGAQVVPMPSCRLRASFQAAEVGQGEVGGGVVLLLGFEVLAHGVGHAFQG